MQTPALHGYAVVTVVDHYRSTGRAPIRLAGLRPHPTVLCIGAAAFYCLVKNPSWCLSHSVEGCGREAMSTPTSESIFMNAMGRGGWRAYAGIRDGKASYAVWAEYQSDIFCAVPDKNMSLGHMALQLSGGNRTPTKLDHVRYILSKHGDFTSDVDENKELEANRCRLLHEVDMRTSLLAPAQSMVSLGGNLTDLAGMFLGNDAGFEAVVRIGLIDGDWRDKTGLNNNSRFVFIPVDGFAKAWSNMQMLMDPACAVLCRIAELQGGDS